MQGINSEIAKRLMSKYGLKKVVTCTTREPRIGEVNDIDYLRGRYKSVAVITRDSNTANELYEKLHEDMPISLLNSQSEEFNKELVVLPAYLAKGLEFDSVIVYSDKKSKYQRNEKNLLYVACTRAQHELIVYSIK
jgi:DNA helicase-2/ATP-dependent DNA helicase PcrA